MAQYWYRTKATIKNIDDYPEQFHCQKDGVGPFCASDSTTIIFEAFRHHLSMDEQKEQESDHAGNNLPAAAKQCQVEEDKTETESHISQHL